MDEVQKHNSFKTIRMLEGAFDHMHTLITLLYYNTLYACPGTGTVQSV
jgi:hypothetical protein